VMNCAEMQLAVIIKLDSNEIRVCCVLLQFGYAVSAMCF